MAYSPRDLSVLAYANGFTLWHYTTNDDKVLVASPDYFCPEHALFRVGDIIHTITNTDDDITYLNILIASKDGKTLRSKVTGQ